MKIPHVTVEFREEETMALGKLSWALILGFAVHWAWTYLIFAGPALVLLDMPAEVRNAGLISSMAFLSVTLFCYGIFLKRLRPVFKLEARPKIRLVGAICMCVGMALLWASAQVGGWGIALGVGSGAFTGFGSAILLMSFGVSFSVFDTSTAAFTTGVSLLLSTLAFLGVVTVFRQAGTAGIVLCLVMPFVELVCLNRSSAQLVDRLEFNSITLSVHALPFFIHVFLPGLVFGFIIGIIRTIAFVGIPYTADFDAYGQAFLLAGVLTGALIIAAMMTQRETNNFMFRTLLPIAAVLLASLYYVGDSAPFYATFALITTYLLLEACIWVFFADISQRFRISAFTVFGFGRGSFTLGSIASYCFMLFNQPGSYVGEPVYGRLVSIAFVAFVLGYSFLPKNRELRHTLKKRAKCLTLPRFDDMPVGELSQVEAVADSIRDTGAPVQAQAAGPVRQSTGDAQDHGKAPAPAGDAAAATAKTKPNPATTAETVAHPQPSGDIRSGGSAHQASATAQPDAERMKVIGAMEDRIEADEEERRQHLGRFKKKCAAVADTYLLTRKETEVLFLLAKGKNSAAIQEQLYISAGTANTHMRRIYRKLDVHSQQELIRLVESTDVSDWDD